GVAASSPARRSSDLKHRAFHCRPKARKAPARDTRPLGIIGDHARGHHDTPSTPPGLHRGRAMRMTLRDRIAAYRKKGAEAEAPRSEEHTSELQSREN